MAFADIFKLKRALFQIDNAYLYAQGTKVICVGCALFWNKLLKKMTGEHIMRLTARRLQINKQ